MTKRQLVMRSWQGSAFPVIRKRSPLCVRRPRIERLLPELLGYFLILGYFLNYSALERVGT
jgi:hypothetical protein